MGTLGKLYREPKVLMLDRILSVNLGSELVRNDWLKGAMSSLKHKWDCSQVEDDFGEGDVMDWYGDDEMMRQWEEVCKEHGR